MVKKLLIISFFIITSIFIISKFSSQTFAAKPVERGELFRGVWTDSNGNTQGEWIWCVSSNYHNCYPVSGEPILINE